MTYSKGIQNRINRVEGQVKGVKKMVMDGETNIKVMTQLQACISSLESVEDVKKSLGLT